MTSAFNQAEGFINQISLGNLHNGNVAGVMNNIDRIESGNVLGGAQGIIQQSSNADRSQNLSVGGNLHADQRPRTERAMAWTKRKFEGYP
jgi:hypothetical protein